jgi:alpha/beta hydrolase family protein
MTAYAAFSLMKAAVELFQSIIALRLSTNSLPPSKMRALQQHG